MSKRPKYLRNSHESAFIMFFIILREVDSKISPLVLGDILVVFFNTLTADAK